MRHPSHHTLPPGQELVSYGQQGFSSAGVELHKQETHRENGASSPCLRLSFGGSWAVYPEQAREVESGVGDPWARKPGV